MRFARLTSTLFVTRRGWRKWHVVVDRMIGASVVACGRELPHEETEAREVDGQAITGPRCGHCRRELERLHRVWEAAGV